MAEAWGVVPGDAPRWAAEMEDHLRGLVSEGSLDVHPTRLDTSAVSDRYHTLAELDDAGVALRIHGHLHLALVIRAATVLSVPHFAVEPDRTPPNRTPTPSPPRSRPGPA